MIGKIVNYRYEILEKVGDGAIFSVYRARDKVLNRLVGVKALAKELAESKAFATSVIQSYQGVASLAHPNIAQVYDADCAGEDCYVVTEYVHGTNVKDRIRRSGPMDTRLALDIMVPVLEALEYAHANRVVHGDLRPQDIIVSPDGEVKVTDFGLGYALQKCPECADRFPMRSVHYQAPEVIEGGQPTISSDIYSAGVILYEMLTAALPFEGSTAISVALKKVKELPVPPRTINIGIPKSLNDLVMRAMEKAPADRYTSISAMLADLRVIRDSLRMGTPVSVSQYTPTKRVEEPEYQPVAEDSMKTRFVWLLVLFAVVVMITLGATVFLLKNQGTVTVPPILGMTWEKALAKAEEEGLELIKSGEEYSDTYKEGEISSVLPEAGSKVPRSDPRVRVTISKGPRTNEVPDLVGVSRRDATDSIVDAGFSVGKITQQYNDRVPAGDIISQDPFAGDRVSAGSSINIVVSRGPEPEPDKPDEPATAEPVKRTFNIKINVPEEAQGTQDVVVEVTDEDGTTTKYNQPHQPGENFSVPVSTTGSPVTIRVYVGGELIKDETQQ